MSMPHKKSLRRELRDIKDSYLQYVIKDRFSTTSSKSSKNTQTGLAEMIEAYKKLKHELTKERLKNLSLPTNQNQKYKRPITPKYSVNEAALNYDATKRIIEMSKPKRKYLMKEEEIVPGSVKLGALEHQTTEKEYELSAPRTWKFPWNHSTDKDQPFSTSKAAMRYTPSRRICELAKPPERKMYD
ncbi:uncharacterized protein [Onthophagus taurus]|uniref:uncharacterized protein isoform X2 n=1 Tax=Onthophagus taurus TaxID=166361 RepID=UPI0039BE8453